MGPKELSHSFAPIFDTAGGGRGVLRFSLINVPLADAVHTPALKRRLSFCLSSTRGQDMQGGKAQARLRLDSTSRLCRASSTGIALSGRCP